MKKRLFENLHGELPTDRICAALFAGRTNAVIGEFVHRKRNKGRGVKRAALLCVN